jgi:hypothetical protein
MGFADHGGMWGDLLLLPLANAVIVPHLTLGPWLAVALVIATIASVWVHTKWGDRRADCPSPHEARSAESYEPSPTSREAASPVDGRGDHMWPARSLGTWWGDLSVAGWAHVLYVIGELTLLIGFVIHDVPSHVVLLAAAVFTLHVPIGLLQPRYFLTRHIATTREQPLLLPCLAALWIVIAVKW